MKQQIYVTYGLGDKFYPEKVLIDLHCFCGKPVSAWWGSPINAYYGWKEWCENEDFIPKSCTKSYYFSNSNKILWSLKEDTKILMINSVSDLEDFLDKGYIKENEKYMSLTTYVWDFYKVVEDGYSAVQLNDARIGHYFINHLEMMMNGWDCESIAVLDPSKIIILKEEDIKDE